MLYAQDRCDESWFAVGVGSRTSDRRGELVSLVPRLCSVTTLHLFSLCLMDETIAGKMYQFSEIMGTVLSARCKLKFYTVVLLWFR